MSEIATIIDAIIRNSIASEFKAEGYKKKARTFIQDNGDHVKVVNFQASQRNQGGKGSFTMNLGVYFPLVAEAIDWFPIKNLPAETDCTIRTRLGFLQPNGCDYWWEIEPNTKIEQIEAELPKAWEDYGKPWLDQVSTLDDAKSALIKSKGYFQAAGIALVQGNNEESSDLLQYAIKRQPLAKAKLNSWGRKNNLI